MTKTKIALIQMKMSSEPKKNISHAINKIRLANNRGAKIICLPELFLSNYFCQTENHSKFKLAEMTTEAEIGRTFYDQCVFELNEKKLTPEKAAMAKWWLTELELKIVDQCLQLHGGYGYIKEYPIAKAYLNSRVQTIYGGTTEIMKEIIGKSLGF